ncbi:MAG: ATP-binding cassette domain-containing protein [Oscillospiraceae bacterium]|nr:ATP-binding cassette domain-containing protein [Oscillospiraceae bacterium]
MLELKNISVSAKDDDSIEIINGVNLTLEEKKIYVITGPNGGGKTSLAKAIMGIYPVSAGKISLDGKDITDKTITERAKLGIGYAFQAPPRFKGLMVRDILSIACNASNKKADEKTLFSLLADVGLCAQDYIDRELCASFSGGELKRVEIATLLARDLRVALFDEPEAGIDLWSFQKLTDTFRALHEKANMTIVIISHQERILRLADEVILICGGRVSDITTPEKILGDVNFFDEPGCFCPNCFSRKKV